MTKVKCSCCSQLLLTSCTVNSVSTLRLFVTKVGTVTLALCSICCNDRYKLLSFLCSRCQVVAKDEYTALKQCLFYANKNDQLALKTFINHKSATLIRDQAKFLNSVQQNMPNVEQLVTESIKRTKEKFEKAIIEIIQSEVPILEGVIKASLSNTNLKMETAEQKKELLKKELYQSRIQCSKVDNQETAEKWNIQTEIQAKLFSQQCSTQISLLIDKEINKLKAKAEQLKTLIKEANSILGNLDTAADISILAESLEAKQKFSNKLFNFSSNLVVSQQKQEQPKLAIPEKKTSAEALNLQQKQSLFSTNQSLSGNFQIKPSKGGIFGASQTKLSGGSLFGAPQIKPSKGGIFGTPQTKLSGGTGGSLVGTSQIKPSGGNLFGSSQTKPSGGRIFGASQIFSFSNANGTNIFGYKH